jgi:excisionase family DNA binding protein
MASTVDNANREARFLTVPEVAATLGVSRVRCYELVATGAIPSVRLSARCIRVPRAWIEAQESTAMGEAHR